MPAKKLCRWQTINQFAAEEKFDHGAFLSDQKELNAKLVKTAPTPFASDVGLQTTNSNAMMDAMASRNATNIKATAAVLCSPAHLAASKRLTEYCGTTVSP